MSALLTNVVFHITQSMLRSIRRQKITNTQITQVRQLCSAFKG